MTELYYHPSPNPAKVALLLEESGTPYELVPVGTHEGEQHSPAGIWAAVPVACRSATCRRS